MLSRLGTYASSIASQAITDKMVRPVNRLTVGMKVIFTVNVWRGSIMPEFGLTAKLRGVVVFTLNIMFLWGDVFLMDREVLINYSSVAVFYFSFSMVSSLMEITTFESSN